MRRRDKEGGKAAETAGPTSKRRNAPKAARRLHFSGCGEKTNTNRAATRELKEAFQQQTATSEVLKVISVRRES